MVSSPNTTIQIKDLIAMIGRVRALLRQSLKLNKTTSHVYKMVKAL